jgi:hypothetical protein
MKTRRVVTVVTADHVSDFASDGAPPRSESFEAVPGFEASMIWADDSARLDRLSSIDTTSQSKSWLPKPGGSRLLKVVFPPDSVFASSDFDPVAASAEYQTKLSGLAEAFEQDDPGMHRTESLDYAVVLDGEIWLELDDSREKHLVQHDIVVQAGTRHAWRNKSNRSTTMLFVLLGKQVG